MRKEYGAVHDAELPDRCADGAGASAGPVDVGVAARLGAWIGSRDTALRDVSSQSLLFCWAFSSCTARPDPSPEVRRTKLP